MTTADVLENKRDATRYRILVEVARRQPAVSQQEIAEEVGVTAQAVSEHLRELASAGYVNREARGHYEVTKEGVDWLITETDSLREYVDRVSTEVIGDVEVDTAIARGPIREGDTVAVRMREGTLTAVPLGRGGSRDSPDRPAAGNSERAGETVEATSSGARAVAVTDAEPGADVGVTEFEGMLDYELGRVTAVEVPAVRDGGSRGIDPDALAARAADHDLVVTSGVEALVAAREAGITPDARFGTEAAVEEAAAKGLDVLLIVVTTQLADHTDRLREISAAYEVVEPDGG